MSRFLPIAAHSLDSFLNLITDPAADALRFLHLLLRSRTALSAEVLFLRKQLAFLAERVTHQPSHGSFEPGSGILEPMEMLLPAQPHGRYFSTDIPKVVARPILGGLHHEYRWESVAA